MLTINNKKQVLKALHAIKNKGPIKPKCGLCENLDRMAYPLNGYVIVRDYAEGWGKHSGNAAFPVPCATSWAGDKAKIGYYEAQRLGTLWDKETEYGQSRWELVDHIIKRLQAEVYGVPS